MAKQKVIECRWCKGRGTVQTSLLETIVCTECNGTGTHTIKEQRKTIQLDIPTHAKLKYSAFENHLTINNYLKNVFKNEKIMEFIEQNIEKGV